MGGLGGRPSNEKIYGEHDSEKQSALDAVLYCALSATECFLSQPLVYGTVFHRTFLKAHLQA